MKDNFSSQSEDYAKYRPQYPLELFEYICSFVKGRDLAWDCATGNGQSAAVLSTYFDRVYATDISEKQLEQAVKEPNITYAKEPAEHTTIKDHTVNLTTVAQSLHWFNFDKFYNEIKRVSAPDALLAVWTYNLPSINPEIDQLLDEFHFDTMAEYWDPERKYVDEGYENIPFPFEELNVTDFKISMKWTIAELEGYINTWSAVQKYISINKTSPVNMFINKVKTLLNPQQVLNAEFPVRLKMAYVV